MSSPFVYRPPATDPLPILHVDDKIIVADKPAGLLSVPGRLPEHKDSLTLRLQADYPDALTVHRLDMETSGVMVFARGEDVHRKLSMAFEARTVSKRYQALVWGEIEGDQGEVDLPIGKDWPNRPRHKVCHETGKPAKTLWRVLDRRVGLTRVELIPLTGRTHQLRIHMAEIGHGILGDEWYGVLESQTARDRLCLHACELGLAHPKTAEPLRFSSAVPF
ncbi:MAG: RNA pseudouridine synthase [Ponticaulis sp.]|nr:RNA pseudouridine synthase [Ponticaulis sp.]|tara:strand:- start:203165 stop:203824 length:660 start_codon:yes stop_codon:yes gene_type:complete